MSKKTTESPVGYQLNPDKSLLDSGVQNDGREVTDVDISASASSFQPGLLGDHHHTVVSYEGVTRLAIMVTPECGGDIRDQAWETVSTIRAILRQQEEPMALTMQTVFVADANDVPAIRKLFEAYFDEKMPLTLFVVQPPCDGVGIAVEAWAIGTATVSVGYYGPHLVIVDHDGLRWVYASSGAIHLAGRSAYEQSEEAFAGLNQILNDVGVPFRDVLRLWLYQGGITESEDEMERYRELNRGRTDFYANVGFSENPLAHQENRQGIYPASTGIGTGEHGLVLTCLAVQTERKDVEILSLENPRQMSAFDYPKEYSNKSPKFSRAMAIRMGDHMTTWISGTASIVDAETVFLGDIEKQTEQTLDNIEMLIGAENFNSLGWADAGATLSDLAKVRVYVKDPEDYEKCRAVCERRLGRVPAVYAQAQVCRSDLLVEIEGVAFSALQGADEAPEEEES